MTLRFALALAVLLLGRPAWAEFPFRPGEPPPAIAGVTLGEAQAEVIKVLGPAERTEVLEAPNSVVRLHWPKKGLAIVVSRLDGAAIMTLTRRDGGAIDGIRVGDSLDDVIQRWGMPQQRVQGDGVWRVGDWDVIVRPAATQPVVSSLTLGWDTSKFAPDAVAKDAGTMQLHPLTGGGR